MQLHGQRVPRHADRPKRTNPLARPKTCRSTCETTCNIPQTRTPSGRLFKYSAAALFCSSPIGAEKHTLFSLVRNMTVGGNKHLKTETGLGSMPASSAVHLQWVCAADLRRSSRKRVFSTKNPLLNPKAGKKIASHLPGRHSQVGGRDHTVNLDFGQNLGTIFALSLCFVGCQTRNFPSAGRRRVGNYLFCS